MANRARTVDGLIDQLSSQAMAHEGHEATGVVQDSTPPIQATGRMVTPFSRDQSSKPLGGFSLRANTLMPKTSPHPVGTSNPVYFDIADKKPTRPDKWTGVRDRAKLEEWVVGVHAYLAAVKFPLDSPLSRQYTPVVWSALLHSFSKDTLPGQQISPREWFISADSSSPFSSPRAVLWAVEANWYDHSAAETALTRFHSAKQHRGTLA